MALLFFFFFTPLVSLLGIAVTFFFFLLVSVTTIRRTVVSSLSVRVLLDLARSEFVNAFSTKQIQSYPLREQWNQLELD